MQLMWSPSTWIYHNHALKKIEMCSDGFKFSVFAQPMQSISLFLWASLWFLASVEPFSNFSQQQYQRGCGAPLRPLSALPPPPATPTLINQRRWFLATLIYKSSIYLSIYHFVINKTSPKNNHHVSGRGGGGRQTLNTRPVDDKWIWNWITKIPSLSLSEHVVLISIRSPPLPVLLVNRVTQIG